MEDIKLKIYEPARVVKEAEVVRVVIPAYQGNLTVIKDRAPTSVLLLNGLVQILDKNDKPIEKIFIQGGVADIAKNSCSISTEKAILFNEISITDAKEKSNDEKLGGDEKNFYKMIANELAVASCR